MDADTPPSASYSTRCVRPLGARKRSGASRSKSCFTRQSRALSRSISDTRRGHPRSLLREILQVERDCSKPQPPNQAILRRRQRRLEERLRQHHRTLRGIHRHRPFAQHDRPVLLSFYGPRFPSGIYGLFDGDLRRLQPGLVDGAGEPDACFRLLAAPSGLDVERNQVLGVAHPALRANHSAIAAGEQHARLPRLAPLRDAIRITGEQSAPQASFSS